MQTAGVGLKLSVFESQLSSINPTHKAGDAGNMKRKSIPKIRRIQVTLVNAHPNGIRPDFSGARVSAFALDLRIDISEFP